MSLQGASPWIASFTLHVAALLFLVGTALGIPDHPAKEQAVDLLVIASPDTGSSGAAGGEGSGVTSKRILPRPALPHQNEPARGGPPVTSGSAHGVVPLERPASDSTMMATLPIPSAADVLADVPPGKPASSADAVPTGNEPSIGAAAQIGWEGSARKLIRRRDPMFPAILSSAGQEVECEAKITVTPSGSVTHVEITRSSGYIEIDASVEAALRDYLFSRVDGRKDAVGMVRFHFRLERQD